MLGYPDETLGEMEATIALARHHRSHGLDHANFFCVMPLPGTPIFDWALAEGKITPDFDPDMMNWTIANMRNTPVPAERVEELRARAWREVNDHEWVKYKLGPTPRGRPICPPDRGHHPVAVEHPGAGECGLRR